LVVFNGVHPLEPHPAFQYLADYRVIISSLISVKCVLLMLHFSTQEMGYRDPI
jgi:hypothetical protein